MGNKVIDEIILAEKKSEQIVSAAKLSSVKSLTSAEEKSAELKAKAQQKSKEDLASFVAQFEHESKTNFDSVLKEYEKSASDLQKKAEQNYQSAVDLIVKKLS